MTPNQPLTLRSSTPGGPRRLHNDNQPAEADIEPLTVGVVTGPSAADVEWDETTELALEGAYMIEESWTGRRADAVVTVVESARKLRTENQKLDASLRKSQGIARHMHAEIRALRADLDELADVSPEIASRLAAVLAAADERAAGRRS